MGDRGPRFLVGGVFLLVLGFVLKQAEFPWAAVAAFVVGLLLVGRGFLGLVGGPAQQRSVVLVSSLDEVPLCFAPDDTRCTMEGTPSSALPSPDLLLKLPIAAHLDAPPSLVVTTSPEGGQVSLLTVLRLADNRFQALAQRWTEEGVIRYTGEVTLEELAQVLEGSSTHLAGGNDAPDRRGDGQ